MLLYWLSWVASFVLICAATFSLSVALYFIAELVEENTVIASKSIRCMILISSLLYLALIPLENFPWMLIVCGLSAQLCHFMLMQTFPAMELKSLWFVGTVGLFLWNHFLAFRHFSEVYYPFNELVAFFVLYMWMVPMSLLVSLSANDMVLPTYNDNIPLVRSRDNLLPSQFAQRRKGYSLKSFLTHIREEYLPKIGLGQKKSF